MEVPPFHLVNATSAALSRATGTSTVRATKVQDRGIGRDELGIKPGALPFKAAREPRLLSDLSKS